MTWKNSGNRGWKKWRDEHCSNRSGKSWWDIHTRFMQLLATNITWLLTEAQATNTHCSIPSFISPFFPCMFQCFQLMLLELIEFSTDLLIHNPFNYRTICENWIHVHEFLGTVDPSFQLRLQNQSVVWVWWLHVRCTSTRSTSSVFSGSWRVYWNSWRERVLWSNKEVKRHGLSFL